MIALRVTLNGSLLCVAGGDNLAVLNTTVGAVGNLGPKTKRRLNEPRQIDLSIGGLSARAEGRDEHVTWARKPLSPGDKIEIQVLETTKVDPPTESRPAETAEEKERHRFEYAKQEYLALRAKFEPS